MRLDWKLRISRFHYRWSKAEWTIRPEDPKPVAPIGVQLGPGYLPPPNLL